MALNVPTKLVNKDPASLVACPIPRASGVAKAVGSSAADKDGLVLESILIAGELTSSTVQTR